MTDDVETPTVVDPPAGAAPPPSGNGSGGAESSGEPVPPPRRDTKRSTKRAALEWGILIAVAILIAIVIKTFLFQAFYIPSESMVPTLEVGDRVLVNKLSYRLHDVHRGDVVVFERPPAAATPGDDSDLIKRVIALPNETIEGRNGRVYIDGKRLAEPYLPKGTISDFNGMPPFKVPPDTYWVMGDNRQNSRDSRFFGPVPTDLIVGRAFLRVWPVRALSLLR